MVVKKLISKVDVYNDENRGCNGFELKYYLIHVHNDVYGIEIQKKCYDGDSEVKILKDILNTREETMQLLQKLATNKVTPVTFEYVVEDFFGTF